MLAVLAFLFSMSVVCGHAAPRTRQLLTAGITDVPGNVSPSSWYRQVDNNVKCSDRPLNLVFMMNPNPVDSGGGISETDWIENSVLRAVDRPIKIWTRPVKLNDSMYVSLSFQDHHKTFFKDMRREGYINFGVYEMGDEKWSPNPADYSYYNDWDYGFRNYFNPHLLEPYKHVQYVHLGMRSGFGLLPPQSLLPSDRRHTTCNFIGSLRSNRADMVSALNRTGVECFMSKDSGWESRENIHSVSYRHILQNSVFTLAPWGNNAESLRLYEALEAGSIPIVQRGDAADPATSLLFLNAINGRPVPFPVIDDWAQMSNVVGSLSVSELVRMQHMSMQWWHETKRIMRLNVATSITKSFCIVYGGDCCKQRQRTYL